MRALIGVLLLGLCLAERVHYNGYQVWKVFVNGPEDVDFLMSQQDLGLLDVHGSITRAGSGDIAIPPKFLRPLAVQLRKRNIAWTVQTEDLEVLVEAERQRLEVRTMAYDPNDFNTLDDNINHMNDYVSTCSSKGLQCTITNAGNSYENRPIYIYKISTGGNKPIVWIDATIHAREWLATTTAVRMFDHIIDNYGSDTEVNDMLRDFDFWILPIGNPDGYLQTWSGNRYWRKNLRPQGSGCTGVDLNRNFDYNWCRQGASTSPCSETFCGSSGASEPETQAYQSAIEGASGSMIALITLHSYGNMWMHPYGNRVGFSPIAPCERADDHDDMFAAAQAASEAIQSLNGNRWAYGTSCEVIYATTGATDDWAKGVAGIKYSFNPELRGTDFVVSPSQITPSFQETWAATVATVRTIESIEGSGFPITKK